MVFMDSCLILLLHPLEMRFELTLLPQMINMFLMHVDWQMEGLLSLFKIMETEMEIASEYT